jgi:hypothetical protein
LTGLGVTCNEHTISSPTTQQQQQKRAALGRKSAGCNSLRQPIDGGDAGVRAATAAKLLHRAEQQRGGVRVLRGEQ